MVWMNRVAPKSPNICSSRARTDDAFHGALSFVGGSRIRLLPVSGGAIRPTDAAEARVAQRHERALLDPATGIGPRVTHDLARLGDRLQIAVDDFVERCSFRAGDLDDVVSRRCERHIGDHGSNVVRSDRLEQAGRNLDRASIRT
jgi:hypothetical protein